MTTRSTRSPGRITTAAMQPLLTAVRSSGADPGALLRSMGVDPSAFREGRSRWLSALLTDRLWQTATAHQPDLPLRIAASVEPSTFGLLTYLLASHDTTRAALVGLTRYYSLLSEATTYRLDIGARAACMTLDLHGPRPPSVESFAVAVSLCFVRQQALGPLVVKEVRLTQERPRPDLAGSHETFLGAPVQFGCSTTAYVFDRQALNVPLRRADPGLLVLLEEHAASILAAPSTSDLAARVRDQLAARGVDCSARSEDVAADLGMSDRTLRRLLQAEGTTFRAELDAVLAAAASELLARGGGTEDVAAALGFADAAAFRRAFRRWFGTSPGTHASAVRGVTPRRR
ncbi:AraC family transcriptional regulator ligand-binding domain-containing protein [Nannocystis sp. ILAH1]|uniref:AraC family transcriptional regulator ligand-binding domain-containing protein n=1 Tax=unclassified Nannocystis TaxID=2627009 RepID=UPI00227189C3|nr:MULTISPECIES: AraC family transcriptional regulator ligand-binding domain-containing protein [unclassified Nannocystis]MCY0988965.1 AraC family transcriptional regulator ligand-binding domain-containing protein [Nannocystis sp. ILAH1]MCY1072610.1 AraC family transcriptional regulator ligand-binding domain-containing protein [Nannocystis sp. RBIL2]